MISTTPCNNFLYYNDELLLAATNADEIALLNVTKASGLNSTVSTLTHTTNSSARVSWLEEMRKQNLLIYFYFLS